MGETRAPLAKRPRKPTVGVPQTLPSAESPTPRELGPQAAAVALLVMLLLAAIVRIRLLELPLERDEGEYAYAGQLILQGVPPYELVYNMKFPGTYAAYAAIMGLFGQTIGGIRFGLMLVTSATALLLYFLAARLFGRVAGLVTAATHLTLTLNIAAMATYAHATQFVTLPAVAGMLLLVPREGERVKPIRYVFAGVCFALAVLMKQPGATYGIMAAIFLLDPTRKREDPGAKPLRDVSLVAAGGIAVAVLTAIVLAAAGVFRKFWFWTIDYAREYVTNETWSNAKEMFDQNFGGIFICGPLLWFVALAGLALLFVEPSARRHWKFVAAFTLAGALGTTPGLYFRHHYFIVFFPAAALLCGIAVSSSMKLLEHRGFSRAVIAIPIVIAILIPLNSAKAQWWLLSDDYHGITKKIYGPSPFGEAIPIAEYIRRNTAPDDRIAILGSEPEIYFYSGRRSATGYIYTYALMELQKFAGQMQREMIAEIERANPKYLVVVSGASSWVVREGSDRTILDWIQKKVAAGYVVDGVIDISREGTTYVWGPEARTYKPKTTDVVMLFKRVS